VASQMVEVLKVCPEHPLSARDNGRCFRGAEIGEAAACPIYRER
jgi:hypothetical protein